MTAKSASPTRLPPLPVASPPESPCAAAELAPMQNRQTNGGPRHHGYDILVSIAGKKKAPPERGRPCSVRKFIAPGPGPLQRLNHLWNTEPHHLPLPIPGLGSLVGLQGRDDRRFPTMPLDERVGGAVIVGIGVQREKPRRIYRQGLTVSPRGNTVVSLPQAMSS